MLFSVQSVYLSVAVVFSLVLYGQAKTRIYYIGTKDVDWDFAPSGYNQVNGKRLQDDEHASVFTEKGKSRIGRVYKKTVYREFTNAYFTTEKTHDPNLGFLGPVIKGEVGDVLLVIFKNMATRNYTMHSHGVLYKKHSEGSPYDDKTIPLLKKDDHVPPGHTYAYSWLISNDVAPTKGDSNCLAWLYHSHYDPIKDINTGLIGPLITCKKGTLSASGMEHNVSKENIMLFSVIDENQSWHLKENLATNGINLTDDEQQDEDFVESNLMHSINGYMYGNLHFKDNCNGGNIKWYLIGVGNEVDIHTVHFHGNSMLVSHHRLDVQNVAPGQGETISMSLTNEGKWMISCQVADHLSAGMIAFYSSKRCGNSYHQRKRLKGQLRTFYIAAEEVVWDFGPSRWNVYDGGNLNAVGSASRTFFENGKDRIGGKYIKARYIEYEDASFKRKKKRGRNEKHLGILGPIIRAEVGDTISVFFKNKASIPFSIHPHGVSYSKFHEGSEYKDGSSGAAVHPGKTFTYLWSVPLSYEPTAEDLPCISYFYSSSVNPVKDLYSGLIGPLVVCKKGSLNQNGLPIQFDNELFLYFAVMDENQSWYLEKNMERFCTKENCNGIDKEDEDFVESNKMHQINGFMYGNTNGLHAFEGQKVLWHLIGMGTEVDIHSIYFDGNAISYRGNHKDSISVLPGTYSTVSMRARNIGKWSLTCKTNDHYEAGMKTFYHVYKTKNDNKRFHYDSVKTYHIGIVEGDWDYAPTDKNLILNEPLDKKGSQSYIFTHRGKDSIGKVYKKALYREYQDVTFRREKLRTEDDKHLGILGPLIIAEEGEQIKIVLKNMGTREYNIYPHGVSHSLLKDRERKGIAPGETKVFTWTVTKEAAPGIHDPPCITWAYYSNVDIVKDTNSGLIGPLVTCKKGELNSQQRRKHIDRAFALLFTVFDENESWYLKENIKKYVQNPTTIDTVDEDFKESNKMHTINGLIFGNAQHFVMTEDERVDWYLIGMGNEVDMHTVHFHGQTFKTKETSSHRNDVVTLYPGITTTIEMVAKSPGRWLLHCHVNDHISAGMKTIIVIQKRKR